MANKVNLDEIVDSSTEAELDLHFFKATITSDLNAKFLFQSLLELERFSHDTYGDVLKCFNLKEQEEFSNIRVLKADSEAIKEDKELELLLYHDHLAYINKWLLANDLPPMESLGHKLLSAISSYKAININNLFIDYLANKKGTIILKFNAESDEDGLSVEKKNKLFTEIQNCKDINQMALLVFLYYKKDYMKIYEALCASVVRFLAQFK